MLVARFSHETNTFAPRKTVASDFFSDIEGTAAESFVRVCRERHYDVIEGGIATANPSGTVDHAVFEQRCSVLLEQVKKNVSSLRGVLLDLHGAMVTSEIEDAEGEILQRLRNVLPPHVVIGVALDLHGNITKKMCQLADVAVSFRTYPHVDMLETGTRAAHLTLDLVEIRQKKDFFSYSMSFFHLPLLCHTLMSRTDVASFAMAKAVEMGKKYEQEKKALAVSIFAGFALSDVANVGMSVLVYSINADNASMVAREIAKFIWDNKDGFVYRSPPLEESIREAANWVRENKEEKKELENSMEISSSSFCLLLDHGDNVMSGGDASNTLALIEMDRQHFPGRILVGPICDVGVVQSVHKEMGKNILKDLHFLDGGFCMVGDVEVLHRCENAVFIVEGPIYTHQRVDMGRSCVLRWKQMTVVVTEKPMEPYDVGVFESVGIERATFRQYGCMMLKSRMYCRPVFVPLSSGKIVECDTRGITSSDYSLFHYRNIPRPIYPLDKETKFDFE